MKIQQLIEEQMKSFDEKFVYVMRDVYGDGHITDCSDEIKSFTFSDYTRKLIEALGEELTNAGDEASDSPGAEFLRAKQRAKLKELLSNIK